jgi:hypothetical protein
MYLQSGMTHQHPYLTVIITELIGTRRGLVTTTSSDKEMVLQLSARATCTSIQGSVKKFPEFFDIDSLVHHAFVPPGQRVTGHFYVQLLLWLRDAVRRKRRDKWQAGTVVSASRYSTEPYIACCAAIPVITQPPHSPDLPPSDVWLFPALKVDLKGTRFATTEDIKSNATAKLRKIPKEAFRRCFQQWQDLWSKCLCVCV